MSKKLNEWEIDVQTNELYSMIRKKIQKSKKLKNMKGVFPEYGTLHILQSYIDPALYTQLMTNIELTKKEQKAFVSKVINELIIYLHEYDQKLNEYLKAQLQSAKIIIHNSDSVFATDNVGWKLWNSLNYTQIAPKALRNASIKKGQWSSQTCKGCKTVNKPSLEHIANFNIVKKSSKKNTALMFHGSAGRSQKSLLSNIDWTKGGGLLGDGFYLTFNPNEAKIYACRTARLAKDDNGIVLEIQIKDADQIFQHGPWSNNDNGFVRNNIWLDQLNIRNAIKNIKIKRIHIFPMGKFKQYSPNIKGSLFYVDPTSKGVLCTKTQNDLVLQNDPTLPKPWLKYLSTLDNKFFYHNSITGKNTWNRPKNIQSRKIKKKTIKEKRADCKKQGLVYDTTTKRCRKSKKKIKIKSKSKSKIKSKSKSKRKSKRVRSRGSKSKRV